MKITASGLLEVTGVAAALTLVTFAVLDRTKQTPSELRPVTVATAPGAHSPAKKNRKASESQGMRIVYELDVTTSVSGSFRLLAKIAFADSVTRLPRAGRGAVDIYLRKISHASGTDAAAIASYDIPSVSDCSANPFDQRCRTRQREELEAARARATGIGEDIRRRTFRPEGTGTVIRPGLAAAADLLAGFNGERWLIVASDMKPQNSIAARPHVDLTGVNVVVLFACRGPIATCQQRRNRWTDELRNQDHALDVTFLSTQQARLLFPAA